MATTDERLKSWGDFMRAVHEGKRGNFGPARAIEARQGTLWGCCGECAATRNLAGYSVWEGEMSIDALVAGKLWKNPEERRSGAGKMFVTANVRAADGDGEALFVNVVAFSESAKAALLALEDGDSVSLAGTLKIGTYEARDGSVKPNVSMVAQRVLTAYHVARKRKAAADTPDAVSRAAREPSLVDDSMAF